MIFGNNGNNTPEQEEPEPDTNVAERRRKIKFDLLSGKLEEDIIEIDVEDTAPNMMDMFAGQEMTRWA